MPVVDAEFCRALLKSKIIAKDTFPEVLGGAVKIRRHAVHAPVLTDG